jgi:hypothetical protein
VMQLPRGDEDCIKQLVDLQVPSLGLVEDLADVVHWTLDGSDPPGGGVRCVYFHWSGPGSSRSSVSGETSEVQDPMTACLVMRAHNCIRGLGPDCYDNSWFLHRSRVLRP